MKASRIAAVGVVTAAGLWIASGHFLPHESAQSRASVRSDGAAKKLFRVAVIDAKVVDHSRKLVLAGRTEADRRVTVTARSGGVLTELRVRRGARVKEGDIIAVLSDDARKAQVAQAESLVIQRRTELEAKRKLIASGAVPKLELVNLEAQLAAAEATLAAAQAELERAFVRAPFSGVVNDVTVEVGGAALPMMGREIATVVALDPMLAVVEVSERRLADPVLQPRGGFARPTEHADHHAAVVAAPDRAVRRQRIGAVALVTIDRRRREGRRCACVRQQAAKVVTADGRQHIGVIESKGVPA